MSEKVGLQTVFVGERATARRLRKAKLVVLDGEDRGAEFVIDRAKIWAGRSSVCDFQLADASISGTHFEVRAEEEGFVLEDLDSTNGTRIGGCRIREIELAPEATFRAGNASIKLVPSDEVVEIPLSEEEHYRGVIGRSVAMREVFAMCEKVAPSELTVLVEGDTGTGKERIARALHDGSRRRNKPYEVLDCSAIPGELMESYVFGHEKGAFTGANARRPGIFEQAEGGTVFMDEVGELPLDLQPKLLRVLENREFKRVGGTRTIGADCRIIAATNRDLREMVQEGTFREDLYFRLSVVQLELPALRERREDIPLLVEHFLDEANERRPDRPKMRLTAEALEALMEHPWPGNVRELRNVVVRAASLASGTSIDRSDLHLSGQLGGATAEPAPADGPEADVRYDVDLEIEYKEAKSQLIDDFEYAYLSDLIDEHEGNLSAAARASGLTRYHLRELLKKHELR
jgi:transcriptional regulator with GAF, ATPase, and Fis domain